MKFLLMYSIKSRITRKCHVPINQLSTVKVTSDYRDNVCNQILLENCAKHNAKHVDICTDDTESVCDVCNAIYYDKSSHNCCETLLTKIKSLEILNESLAKKLNSVNVKNKILSLKLKIALKEKQLKTQEIETLTQFNNTIKQQIFNLSSSVRYFDTRLSQRIKPHVIASNENKCEIKCDRIYYAYICDKSMNTKNGIENESKTKIYVPRDNEPQRLIVINGQTKDAVKLAKTRIEALVSYWKSKSKCTHFVSMPINKSEIIERFYEFKQKVLSNEECVKSHGINECLFQEPNKLHLSIASLFLSDQNDIDNASDILNQCYNDYIRKLTKGPIPIKLEGIVHVTNDPTKVTAIYAKVIDLSENQCIQQIVNEIYSRFKKTKFMNSPPLFGEADYRINDGLNMVIIKSAFKHKLDASNACNDQYESFDATAIMKHFSDYMFGHTFIDTIHISVCHSSAGHDGYYTHTHFINLDSC